jgi:acetyl-CoA acetyltransferase
MIHVRHAAAAIASGLCETVLITHGESGRSGVGRTRNVMAPTSFAGQFEQPYGPMGPPTLFTTPVLRYMKIYGLSHEQLVMVSVVQREWAAKNPRATFKTPITVVIVSLGLVRFCRAAAPIEAKIAASGPCNCHTRIISYWIDSCELVQDCL